jgi:hypothetical protein
LIIFRGVFVEMDGKLRERRAEENALNEGETRESFGKC